MLSKAKLKYIKSLQLKKYRKEEQSFVVEGAKSVVELLTSDFEVTLIAVTPDFRAEHERYLRKPQAEIIEISETELSSLGSLQSNNGALAVARMRPNVLTKPGHDEFVIALDDIRDPGNVGTIIRTADWYGIKTIIASEETADFYNAKTISASMGSFCRVNMFYTSLEEYLKDETRVYGAFLNGTDVHRIKFGPGGVIVVGNESNGISAGVASRITQRITIPRFGQAESLNAGVATAIILDNLKRSEE